MKKHNLHSRRARALDRLNAQIKDRRVSPEFEERIAGLKGTVRSEELAKYWDRKDKELANLQSKLSSY